MLGLNWKGTTGEPAVCGFEDSCRRLKGKVAVPEVQEFLDGTPFAWFGLRSGCNLRSCGGEHFRCIS